MELLSAIPSFVRSVLEAIPEKYRWICAILVLFAGLLTIGSETFCYPYLCESRNMYGYYGEYKKQSQPTGNEKFTHWHRWIISGKIDAHSTFTEEQSALINREATYRGFKEDDRITLSYIAKNAGSMDDLPASGSAILKLSDNDYIGYIIYYDPQPSSDRAHGKYEICPYVLSSSDIVVADVYRKWPKLSEQCVDVLMEEPSRLCRKPNANDKCDGE